MADVVENRKEKIKTKLARWLKDPYNLTFIIILAAAFAIRFWIFLGTINQPLWYDEANFLATAKRWAGLQVNDIWYYRRGFFWVLFPAILFKLGFGETGIRFSEVLFSTGLVALSYFLIKEMFDKKYALLASLGVALSWIVLFFTARPMTEIPATFFLLLAFLCFWKGYVKNQGRKYFYLFGLFFAISLLTRFQYAMFVLPLIVLTFTKEKFKFLKNKNLWLSILVFFIVLIPFFILYSSHYGFFVKDIIAYYLGIGQPVDIGSAAATKTFANFFDYFKNLPYMLSWYILIPFLVGIFFFFVDMVFGIDKIFNNENIQKKLFVFLLIVVPFIALGRITDYVEQRYIMPMLPFLFLIAAYSFNVFDYIKLGPKSKAFLAFIILLGLLIPSFLWANQLIDSKKTSYIEVKDAGLWIKQNSNSSDIVVSNSLPQIIYYSERATYPMALYRQGLHYQNPELMKYKDGEAGFDEFVIEKKPRYLMLSAFENHDEWMYAYPQKHVTELVPVLAIPQTQQPVVVVYEFKYA